MTASLHESISNHFVERQTGADAGNFASEAKDTFVKDAVFFQSRDEFNEYMRVLEN